MIFRFLNEVFLCLTVGSYYIESIDVYCVCMCVYLCMGAHMRELCGGQRLIISIYLNWSLQYFMIMIIGMFSHWTWSLLIWLNWLANQPQEFFWLSGYFWNYRYMLLHPYYLRGWWGLNSNLYACKASTLSLRYLHPCLFFLISSTIVGCFSLLLVWGPANQLPNKYMWSYSYLWMPGISWLVFSQCFLIYPIYLLPLGFIFSYFWIHFFLSPWFAV